MEETKNETKEQENSAVSVLEKEENKEKDVPQIENKKEEKEAPKEEKKEPENSQENQSEKEIKIKTLEQAKEEQKEENLIISNKTKYFKTNVILIVIGILVVLTALLSTIFAVINISNTKIMNGISIGKIDVSNMTKEEAKQALNEFYSAKEENEIYLTYDEFETAITYKALEVEYQIENAIKQAYDIGRAGNIFKDNIDILKTWIYGKNIEIEAIIDNDMISQISQNINNNIKGAIVQPSYYVENGKLIITSGKEGLKVNEQQLLEEIYKVLKTDTDDEQNIIIPIVTAEPEKIDIDKY